MSKRSTDDHDRVVTLPEGAARFERRLERTLSRSRGIRFRAYHRLRESSNGY